MCLIVKNLNQQITSQKHCYKKKKNAQKTASAIFMNYNYVLLKYLFGCTVCNAKQEIQIQKKKIKSWHSNYAFAFSVLMTQATASERKERPNASAKVKKKKKTT